MTEHPMFGTSTGARRMTRAATGIAGIERKEENTR